MRRRRGVTWPRSCDAMTLVGLRPGVPGVSVTGDWMNRRARCQSEHLISIRSRDEDIFMADIRMNLPLAFGALLLAGCTGNSAGDAAVTEQWLGRWNGPEGTYLEITGTPADYRLTIANLDGPRRFVGRAQGERIVFVRDGVVETLTATDGEATGMKWLLDKHNCLTVRGGEGYCRD